MKTQPTPGPWRYVKTNGSPTTGQHLISGDRPGYLAEVRDCGSGGLEANARLIAAAPDMLAALELILQNASATRGTDTDFAAWRRLCASEIGAVLTEVRAAIAKAKGAP